MQCPRCNQPLDDDTVFCGNCGAQVAPIQAQGATVTSPFKETRVSDNRAGPVANQPFMPSPEPQTPSYVPSRQTPPQGSYSPPPSPPAGRKSPLASARFRIISALVLIVIVGGAIGLVAALKNNGTSGTAGGQVTFIDNPNGVPGSTDAVKITIQGLQAPASGSHYQAWLVNDASEQITSLGNLTASGQSFVLSYAGNGSSGKAGTNLLGAGNKVEVTLEQGAVSAPASNVELSASFPPKAFIHIRHLLFSFPTTPGKIGLLVGLLGQAQLLNQQAILLQTASKNQNTTAVQCASQSILDIVEGQQGAAFQQLQSTCLSQNVGSAGDGFGLLGPNAYVSLAAQHASLAATQSDSTSVIKQHAQIVEIAMTNINGWATTIDQQALSLRATPNNSAAIQQIVSLADHIYNGFDSNGNGRVDPVAGEAGAITAYSQGQLMATLTLVPGD